MASLLAASRKNFPAACGLHARTKPVRLGSASLARLICALWQNNLPSITACPTREFVAGEHTQAALAACFESSSVLASCRGVKNRRGMVTERGKVKHPFPLCANWDAAIGSPGIL